MMQLAKEVQKRMEGVGVKGRRMTLKAKRRKPGAKPPGKVKVQIMNFLLYYKFYDH